MPSIHDVQQVSVNTDDKRPYSTHPQTPPSIEKQNEHSAEDSLLAYIQLILEMFGLYYSMGRAVNSQKSLLRLLKPPQRALIPLGTCFPHANPTLVI